MNILIKYTLKSMMEKKFRSFLIILAIALSAGLFLASSRLTANIGDSYYQMMTATYGDVDIQIYPDKDSPTAYISSSRCNEVSDLIEHIVPTIRTGAEYKKPEQQTTDYIIVNSYNMEDYLAINEMVVLEGSVEEFSGAQIILSKKGANQLGVSVGDEIDLNLQGKRKVTVVAIVDSKGMFTSESGYVTAIMPFDTISRYVRANGRAGTIYVGVKDGVDVDETILALQEAYPKYVVERVISLDELEEGMGAITGAFLLMTLIVIFMSAFIIYSSFKVIMLEKLPVVGTFRSVGATKLGMNGVLLMEALFYGILGGIGACGLGLGALYVLSTMTVGMMNSGETLPISMEVPINTYILTCLMGIVMAVLSTILPIMSVSKISLKDIILNNRPHKSRRYLKGTIIGVVLVIGGFILPEVMGKDVLMITSMLGLFIVIIGIIKLLPMIVLYSSQILGVAFKLLFGNIGELATKNIKKNSSVLNSITLITIGVGILFSISTMTRNVADQVVDFYKDTFKCDILASIWECDDQRVRIVKRNPNVEKVIEAMSPSVRLADYGDTNIYPEAIQTTELSPDLIFNIQGDEEAILQELQEGRNVVLTEILRKKYDLEVGDMINLKFQNDKVKPYKIIGFMDTLWNNGFFGALPIKYVKLDSDTKTYENLYIRVKEGAIPEEVAQQLTDSFAGITSTYIISVAEQTIRNKEANAALMSIISIFAILAMVIGIVGVINNLMISFIERRQSIAMLRSVGMSKWQVLKMIFIEGLGSGIIGAVAGIVGGMLLCNSLDYVLKGMEQPIHMEIVPELFPSYLIGGMLITVIGSIIPARGSSKLNIIEAIKYE